MRKLKVCRILIPTFLLAVVMAGCSDPDKLAGSGNPGAPLTPPTVTTVTPPKREFRRLPQRRDCHRNIQQGDEPRDDQHHDIYLEWAQRKCDWDSFS